MGRHLVTDESKKLTDDALAPPPEKGAAALVKVGSRGVMIRSLDDLLRFARLAVKGGAAPKGMNEGSAAIAIQAGLERGLGPLGGLTQGVVINGVFSWRGQGAAALIQNSVVCRQGSLRFGCDGDGENAVGFAEAHRVGYARPDRREFSVADAKRAGLWTKQGPWHDYPKRQLMWRALGFLARDVFPDVLGGWPLYEEAVDFDENETPARSPEGARPELPAPTSLDPLMDAIEGKVAIEEKVLQSEIEKDLVRFEVGKQDEVVEAELVPERARPNLPDPDVDVETAVPPPPKSEKKEPEQPSLLPEGPEDKCRHGLVLSVHCVDCDDEEAAIAAERASS